MPIFLCRKRRAPASTLQNGPFQNPRFGALFSNGVEITVLAWPAEHRRKVCRGFGRCVFGRVVIPVRRNMVMMNYTKNRSR